jgi:transcriptional regulator of acetoin/glycerol metabolism
VRQRGALLRRKLAGNEGNVKRTAERLGMQRSHLYKKLERFALK